MKSSVDGHGPLRMTPKDFGDPPDALQIQSSHNSVQTSVANVTRVRTSVILVRYCRGQALGFGPVIYQGIIFSLLCGDKLCFQGLCATSSPPPPSPSSTYCIVILSSQQQKVQDILCTKEKRDLPRT